MSRWGQLPGGSGGGGGLTEAEVQALIDASIANIPPPQAWHAGFALRSDATVDEEYIVATPQRCTFLRLSLVANVAVDGDIQVTVSHDGNTISSVTLTSGSAAGTVASVNMGGAVVNVSQPIVITQLSVNTNPGVAMISIGARMT